MSTIGLSTTTVLQYSVGTTPASGAITLKLLSSRNGWPKLGRVGQLAIRMTAGSAVKYSWGVYSEDPTAPPAGTEAWEFLIAGGFDLSGAGGADQRALVIGSTTVPDVLLNFSADSGRWPAKSSAALDKLYVLFVPDAAAGVDNVWRVRVAAGPVRMQEAADEAQLNEVNSPLP